MDVLITKPEFSNQSSIASNEVSTTQPAEMDLFLDIISKLDSQAMIQKVQTSEKKIPSSIIADVDSTLNLENPADVDSQSDSVTIDQLLQFLNEKNINETNPLLAQILLAQENLQSVSEKDITQLDKFDHALSENNSQLLQNVNKENSLSTFKNIKNSSGAFLPDEIQKSQIHFAENVMEPDFSEIDNSVEMKAEKLMKKNLDNSIQIKELNPANKFQLQDLIEEKQAKEEIKSDQTSFATSSISNHPIVNDQNVQNNKYINALTQLGDFINGQTMNLFKTNESISANSTNQLYYSESLRQTYRPEYDLKIELPLTTIDSAIKETYNANIKIYPPELGQVTAKLKIGNNNAELIILTENNAVKQIVESNLNQLRDSFQQADINLTNIQVDSAQTDPREQNKQNQQSFHEVKEKIEGPEFTSELSAKESQRDNHALVDTYA